MVLSIVRKARKAVQSRLTDHDLKVMIILAISTIIASGLIYYKRIAFPVNSDYSLHVLFAQQMLAGEFEAVPVFTLAHPGLQFVLMGVHFLAFGKIGLYASLMIEQTLAQLATVMVLYFWFGSRAGRYSNWIRAFWAFTLTIVAPIPLMAIWDSMYYYGYIGLASYHNPTTHLLRPIALLIFMLIERMFRELGLSKRSGITLAGLLVISALIKPSYVLCLLPAVAFLVAYSILQKRSVEIKSFVLFFIIPSVVVLFLQWLVTYHYQVGENAAILLRPFAVESAFSDYLMPKFLLSIFFPLVLAICFRKECFSGIDTHIAWLSFVVAVAQMYLLAEGGDRFYHGNFRWGAQITLFILFAVLARKVFREMNWKNIKQNRRLWIVYAAYGAHVIGGIIYYIRSLILTTYS